MSISTFKQSLYAAAGAAALAVGTLASAVAGGCAFLPPTNVQCPSNLKPSQAAFCGVLGEQKWSDVLPHCVAVEKVAPDGSATIVYGWGTASQWRIYDPGYVRREARIEGSVLKASWSRMGGWVNLEYRLVGDTLHGVYSYRGRDQLIALRRFGE